VLAWAPVRCNQSCFPRQGPGNTWQRVLLRAALPDSLCPRKGGQPVPTRGCSFINSTTSLPPLTASSSNTERAGPSTSSQGALEPPRGSQGLENISSGPSSQAASGLPQRSQLPENSHLPSEPGTRQRTVRPRLPADHEASRHRGSGRTTAPRTSSGSRRSTQQRASRPSADSPVAAPRRGPRQQGTGRVRSRSPLQDRASRSQSRPRRSRGSRQTPRQAARSSTLCSATPVTSRPSRGSPQPGHRRASRQQGRAHT